MLCPHFLQMRGLPHPAYIKWNTPLYTHSPASSFPSHCFFFITLITTWYTHFSVVYWLVVCLTFYIRVGRPWCMAKSGLLCKLWLEQRHTTVSHTVYGRVRQLRQRPHASQSRKYFLPDWSLTEKVCQATLLWNVKQTLHLCYCAHSLLPDLLVYDLAQSRHWETMS